MLSQVNWARHQFPETKKPCQNSFPEAWLRNVVSATHSAAVCLVSSAEGLTGVCCCTEMGDLGSCGLRPTHNLRHFTSARALFSIMVLWGSITANTVLHSSKKCQPHLQPPATYLQEFRLSRTGTLLLVSYAWLSLLHGGTACPQLLSHRPGWLEPSDRATGSNRQTSDPCQCSLWFSLL